MCYFLSVKISLGSKVIEDTKEKKKENAETLNPDFFTRYDLETTLPGPSLLTIQVYDHNFFLPARFMGETVIDLEDRWFHPKWTQCGDLKPLEVVHLVLFLQY